MSYQAPPPNYGDQGGYGQPQGGGDHPKAMQAMIWGIVGLVCCQIAAIPAYIIGNKTVKEIDASGGTMGGRGMAQAGKIMGIIGMVLFVLGIIAWIILFATGAATTSFDTSTNP